MGGACSTRDSDEKCIQNCNWNAWKKESHLGNVSVEGKIILKWILKTQAVM